MNIPPSDAPGVTPARPAPQEVDTCIRVLESILEDRALLSSLPPERKRALVIAAGRVSRPERHEVMKLYKAHRREKKRRDREADKQVRAAAGIRAARQSDVFTAPARLLEGSASRNSRGELREPRNCYVCKSRYTRIHFFYDAMCEPCGDFNYEKRFQSASLEGRVAVVTGARVKIGFHVALMLLRAGARVVATTRFPHDAAERYAREPDFDQWRDRLQIHGLDLRHSPSVEWFAEYLDQTCGRLDFLINNACQTVRRPPGFYRHLMDVETRRQEQLAPDLRPLLEGHEACKRGLRTGAEGGEWLTRWAFSGSGIGVAAAPALSQLAYLPGDNAGSELFPEGLRDADLQQVDLREKNSWRLTLAEVQTPELLEVLLINAVAPFILCAKLKPLMLRHPTRDKHIVNVSAMEGKFNRFTKTDKHPHTNMAKAALNMMTLTSAPDYVKDGIHMNAVDTGWVTDEDPFHHATRKREELDFQPPLDIVDGAARICDPIFHGFRTGEHVWGKFLKDYKPTCW